MVSRQEIQAMPTARSGLLAGIILLLAAAGVAAETYGYVLSQGIQLTADAAQQLEASLRTNPGDLFARARLLGYYSAHAARDSVMREARLRQIEWLIANAPACPVLHEPAAHLQPTDFAAPYGGYEETLRHAWQQQVNAKPDDARVTENAYRSLGAVDARENTAEKSVPYLKRLRTLEPGEPPMGRRSRDLIQLRPAARSGTRRPDGRQAVSGRRHCGSGEIQRRRRSRICRHRGL
jgi:hypothetical protein